MTTILPNPFQEKDSCIYNKCAKYIFQISKQIKQTKKQEVAGKAEIIKGFFFSSSFKSTIRKSIIHHI